MSSQAVTLRIPIDEEWDAGDGLQVFTNFGTGDVDTDRPLLVRALDVFPGQQPSRGEGMQPVGVGRAGSYKAGRPRRGIGRTVEGKTPLGTAPGMIEVTVDVPAGFGKWKFAARVVDRSGNVQGGELAVIERMVSGTDPPPLSAFWFDSLNEAGQAVFEFARGEE